MLIDEVVLVFLQFIVQDIEDFLLRGATVGDLMDNAMHLKDGIAHLL